MKQYRISIPLTRGKVAFIDAADLPLLRDYKWSAYRCQNQWYARARVRRVKGAQSYVYMHRVILGAKPGQLIDHINNNGLDNTRANLRFATFHQNAQNRRLSSSNTSGFKGVSWHKNCRKYRSSICHKGRRRLLGHFDSAEEAARAYDDAAKELFGEFAYLNFPEVNTRPAEHPAEALPVNTSFRNLVPAPGKCHCGRPVTRKFTTRDGRHCFEVCNDCFEVGDFAAEEELAA